MGLGLAPSLQCCTWKMLCAVERFRSLRGKDADSGLQGSKGFATGSEGSCSVWFWKPCQAQPELQTFLKTAAGPACMNSPERVTIRRHVSCSLGAKFPSVLQLFWVTAPMQSSRDLGWSNCMAALHCQSASANLSSYQSSFLCPA